MSIKPLADHVAAKKEAPQTKTQSGILLTNESKEQPSVAIVEAVGPDVKALKKGDRIFYREFSESKIKIGNDEYIILKEEDVLATL